MLLIVAMIGALSEASVIHFAFKQRLGQKGLWLLYVANVLCIGVAACGTGFYMIAHPPRARSLLAPPVPGKTSRPLPHCGSTAVHRTHQSLPQKCNLLKARMVIYAHNHHVRLLSPEPAVVDEPQSTRVKEPTLLCNQVPDPRFHNSGKRTY